MKRTFGFTLIEVVIALAILALALAGELQLLTRGQGSIARAMEKWRTMHMLTQGAEYLLLTGNAEDPQVPEEFFPYPDYDFSCEIEDAEGLPQEYTDQENQLPLKKWHFRLVRRSDGKEVESVKVDRFEYPSESSTSAGSGTSSAGSQSSGSGWSSGNNGSGNAQ